MKIVIQIQISLPSKWQILGMVAHACNITSGD